MHRLFPRALVACIAEARSPEPWEFEEVAAKVLRETFGGRAEERFHRLAGLVAYKALTGHFMVIPPGMRS